MQSNLKAIIVVASVIAIVSMYMLSLKAKDKKELKQSTGTIVLIDKQFLNLPARSDIGKYRFISINTYPYVFEIKTGSDAQNIDKLNLGDKITVYYNDLGESDRSGINKTLQFIDKNNSQVYKSSSSYFVFGIIGLIIAAIVGFLGGKLKSWGVNR